MASSDKMDRLENPYPMARTTHRLLESGHVGPVFIWDIDKTYLDTRFSQLKNLIKIPLELGVDKRSYPGIPRLLRLLRAGDTGRAHHPLFFISASPPELRRMVEKKMLIDGIENDGITFKNPLRLVMKAQFDQLREQVAFKITALLFLYRDLPDGCQLYLFGDDAEKDALIYGLFADIAAGRLRGEPMIETLIRCGVRPDYARAVANFAIPLPSRDLVRTLFIHLVRKPDGSSIEPFGPHVVGYKNACAAARALEQRGLLTSEQSESVQRESEPADPLSGGVEQQADGWFTPASHRS